MKNTILNTDAVMKKLEEMEGSIKPMNDNPSRALGYALAIDELKAWTAKQMMNDFETIPGVVGKITHRVTDQMESICEECDLEMMYRDGEGSIDGFVGYECHGCGFSYPV